MRMHPSSRRRMGEQRRYFPDWTARPLERRAELEADHNSYLAGGYAEEFGYRAQPGCSRGVPVLDGESPEECVEWQGQARATHPGYPIRPHPIEVDVDRGARKHDCNKIAGSERSRHEPSGGFVFVSNRPYERMRKGTAQRAAAVSRRFVAAMVELRWKLRRAPAIHVAAALRKARKRRTKSLI